MRQRTDYPNTQIIQDPRGPHGLPLTYFQSSIPVSHIQLYATLHIQPYILFIMAHLQNLPGLNQAYRLQQVRRRSGCQIRRRRGIAEGAGRLVRGGEMAR
jgi:hypothetical protein